MLNKLTAPSYLFIQYFDDANLRAFVNSYNRLAQEYIDWFSTVILPVYTNANINGDLLSWVTQGVYDIKRTPISVVSQAGVVGTYDSIDYNYKDSTYNDTSEIVPTAYVAMTDDILKRVVTWHFYKGDGKIFSIPWLKRRIARFITGTSGTSPDIDQTLNIGVAFNPNREVEITISHADAVPPISSYDSNIVRIFKSAVESNVLELPFQYNWKVTIA